MLRMLMAAGFLVGNASAGVKEIAAVSRNAPDGFADGGGSWVRVISTWMTPLPEDIRMLTEKMRPR
jgi:hypothetical protein